MIEFIQTPAVISILSVSGATCAILGALTAGLAYRGHRGERYSLLNHFISELGEQGISRLAWVFNLGLILCGLCMIPACIGLGLLIPGAWSKLGMAAGIFTSIGVAGVGFFPMNKLKGHILAASTYFRAGLLMVLLFTLAIALQKGASPILPRLFSLAGVPAVLAYATFIVYSWKTGVVPDEALAMLAEDRPRVWWMPVAEWFVFLTTVPWFVAVALRL